VRSTTCIRPSACRPKLPSRPRHRQNNRTDGLAPWRGPSGFSGSCRNLPPKAARGPHRPGLTRSVNGTSWLPTRTRLGRNAIWSRATVVFFGCKRLQSFAYLARGVLRRHAVEIGTGRGCGGRRIRHLAGGCRSDLHLVDVDLEFLGNDLCDLDVQPLPHLGAAMVQVHRAVGVDMHQRAGLIEMCRSERDAEFDRRQRQAALD
jgi:hypothetical protein